MSSDVSSVSKKQQQQMRGIPQQQQPRSNQYSGVGLENQISNVHTPKYNPENDGATLSNKHPLNEDLIQSQNSHPYMMGQYNSNMNAQQQPNAMQNMQLQRRSVSNYSVKSGSQSKMAQFMTAIASVPAIPGKNQRILVNKQRGVSSSKSANRIFNRGTYQNSQNSNIGYEKGGQFSSFISHASSLKENHSNKSFGTTTKRFDAKHAMKELFNLEPGPGAYSQTTADSTMGGNSTSLSSQGFGNGFVSKADRFKKMGNDITTDPNIQVGPGQYDPKKLEKNINVPKFDAKNGFNLPFNESNPLNYVKPITVNIYFKHQNPGVGTYSPEKPYKNVPAAQNVFISHVDRNSFKRRLQQAANEPGPDTYEIQFGFDNAEYEKDKGSRPFRQPVPRKIVPVNLYNPHSEVEDEKHKAVPGPGKYDLPTQFTGLEKKDADKVFPNTGGKVYIENTMDRFGQQILPRKPRDLFPGPFEYNPTPRQNIDDPVITKGGYIPKNEKLLSPRVKEQQNIPGPAFYNASMEPKKISFLFNAAEKWIA